MDTLTDLELEQRAATGDSEAFGELYERYSPRVYDFLRRMVRNEAEAADLMQETFVRAMRSLKLERAGKGELSTWLFTIARNLALTRVEREKRSQSMFDDATDDGLDESLYYGLDPDLLENPEAAAQAGEMVELVWHASQALDPKQRTLLDLHVRQGLESAEIAEVLGVSKGNAYTMVSRLKDTFESAVASLVMFRAGRRNCPELNQLLADAGADAVTPDIRRLIERHTQDCERCQGKRRELVSASALLRALVPMPLMPGMADQIRDNAWQQAQLAGPAGIAGIAVAGDLVAPASSALGARGAASSGAGAASSAPVATGAAAVPGGFLSSIPVAGWIAAAVAVVAVGAGAAFYTVNASGGGGDDRAAASAGASDGDSSTSDRTPADVAVPGDHDDAGSEVVVSAGITHTCAIREGAAWCWGDNQTGALGIGTFNASLRPAPLSDLTTGVTAISTSSPFGSCAVKDGGLWCWGALALGGGGTRPRQVPDMSSGISVISLGNQTVCAVKDGGAWCWGNNRFGQLGTGTTVGSLESFSPVVGMDSGVTDISVNAFHTCALKDAGVWCWGQNLLGELGDGTATNSLVPVPVSGLESGVTELDGNCALKDGAAWCWGDNFENRLFTGATDRCPGGPCSKVALPVQTVDSGVTAVAAENAQSRPCAVKNGAAWCWGSPVTGGTFQPGPVAGLESGVTAISTGVNHVCAVKDGDIYCWGVNDDGQLGDGTTTDRRTTPVLVVFDEPPSGSPSAASPPTRTPAGATDDPELAALKAAISANSPGIVFDPNCSEQSVQPCVALPDYAPGVLARGIACFGGGAKICYGRQANGTWSPWFGTQNSSGPFTDLPGQMLVCADGDGLNLRAEPNTGAAVVGLLVDNTLATGDRYVLTEPGPAGGARFSHGWYHITAPQEGWAYDSYLMDPFGGATCDASWWVGQP